VDLNRDWCKARWVDPSSGTISDRVQKGGTARERKPRAQCQGDQSGPDAEPTVTAVEPGWRVERNVGRTDQTPLVRFTRRSVADDDLSSDLGQHPRRTDTVNIALERLGDLAQLIDVQVNIVNEHSDVAARHG
jgi:hypothetical protein